MGLCQSTSSVSPQVIKSIDSIDQKKNEEPIVVPHVKTATIPQQKAVKLPPVQKPDEANFKPIGVSAGVGLSPTSTTVIVKERLFSSDSFHIKQFPSRGPLGNGVHIKGKRFTRLDKMGLYDGEGKILAVCIQKRDFGGKTFKLCVPEPVSAGQPPDEVFNHQPMYTYCIVKHVPFHNGQDVFLAGKDVPEYEIRVGGFGPRKLVMQKRGVQSPVATVEGKMLTIQPNYDICLMICLLAICDEMDDDHRGPGGMVERDMRREMRGEMRGGRRGRRS